MAPIRSKLMEISYSDPKFQIRLTGYADTVIIDSGTQQTISAIRLSRSRSGSIGRHIRWRVGRAETRRYDSISGLQAQRLPTAAVPRRDICRCDPDGQR